MKGLLPWEQGGPSDDALHAPGTERLAEQTVGGGSQFSLLEAT